ncbi:alpha/beta hydrolase [Frateuria soli]|uniref:alpha/beta hydrolase n=1 Tax=Frateuria soli TaxID=1542730 RepID=UPI001E5C00EC|nr:alpha/beta hydrolase [Frateuria soli]UGB37216.1 alpha/beta hydrolase [Frateuria soli]
MPARTPRLIGRCLTLLAIVMLPLAARAGEPVTLKASDGGTVYGTLNRAGGHAGAILLLFHQAGASRHEYDPLVPVFTKMGYDTLAIDQRSGDGLFGGRNETVDKRGGSTGYLDALPDLEGALAWAKAHHYARIALVGSSYSSSLAIVLAARHPRDVAAVASFSPGEYFDDDKNLVKRAAAKVAVPFYITTPPEEEDRVGEVLRDAHGADITHFRQAHGVHGASTLVQSRDPRGYAANLRSFSDFLRRALPAKAR